MSLPDQLSDNVAKSILGKVGQEENKTDGYFRDRLARNVIVGTLIVLGMVAAIAMIVEGDSAIDIFNASLPVIAAWVGMVLAFYFGRENFEAAARNTRELTKELTKQQQLMSIPVINIMLRKAQIHFEQTSSSESAKALCLTAILDRLDATNKGARIPILDDQDRPLYVIHRSVIDSFLAKMALKGGQNLQELTLKDLCSDEIGSGLTTSLALVQEDASLADAKEAMDRKPNCQDVFVTQHGTAFEPMLGWITNVVIQDNAKV